MYNVNDKDLFIYYYKLFLIRAWPVLMSTVGKSNEVPSEVKNGKSYIEDRIIKVGKILHMFQFSGFIRFTWFLFFR